jgi:glycosyltransferase involved in cell wall biosynthesis
VNAGPPRYLVVSNAYPRAGNLYRNQFLHSRVLAYLGLGLTCEVYVVDYTMKGAQTSAYEYEGVTVLTGSIEAYGDQLARGDYTKLLVHFPMPYMLEPIDTRTPDTPTTFWLHGYETEAWWRRWFNHLDGERLPRSVMQQQRDTADGRLEALRSFLDRHPDTEVVTVSDWFRVHCIEPDLGRPLPNASIIPNFVDSTLFQPAERSPEAQRRVLVLRPFTYAKYAGRDIVEAVLRVTQADASVRFTICGDGPQFDEAVRPLVQLDNVEIRRGFLSRAEVAQLHREHGVFLNPSWWDSQGVSTSEAMASGLAVATTNRSAIPEFVEHEVSGLLSPPGDVEELARHVLRFTSDDELRERVGRAARQRVVEQCGFEATIEREVELIRGPHTATTSPPVDWQARYAELAAEFSDVLCRLGRDDP